MSGVGMKVPQSLLVVLESGTSVTALVYRARPDPPSPMGAFVLAHGAGAGQRSPFLTRFAQALADRALDVVTFNFPYTEQGRRLPDRAPVLEACYATVVEKVRQALPSAGAKLVIGGKSMGGRIATQVAATRSALPVTGLVVLGYPLHPPGRPDTRRDAHLPSVRRPVLFVQGERDSFGTPGELAPVLDQMVPRPAMHVVNGGDHSFKVRRAGAPAQEAVENDIQRVIADWIERL